MEARTLAALLYYTNKTVSPLEHPEDFAHCLTKSGEVNWGVFAVMGGSEGSGQAAFVGYHRKVDRVIQFSGIDDGVVYDLNAGVCRSETLLASPPRAPQVGGRSLSHCRIIICIFLSASDRLGAVLAEI